MIKRTKGAAPALLTDSKWDRLKLDALTRRNAHKVSTPCYRDASIEALLNLYENKCAFCERERGTEINVDHYRPKKARNKMTNVQYNQPGYYWLPYTWSNLLPLCSKCNQFKTNKFPLTGWNEANRLNTHENPIGRSDAQRFDLAYLNNSENPLLLNPEYENQEFFDHFAFNENGRIAGKTDKARETIVLCNLDRRDLRRERRGLIMLYVNLIKDEIDTYENHNKNNPIRNELLQHGLGIVFKLIKDNCLSHRPFTLLSMYIIKYFDSVILHHIAGNKTKAFVSQAFKGYKIRHNL